MENRKATEAGQDVTMQKEDFAALWKTIHLKVTGKSSVSCPLKPSDSAPLKHSTMPP